MWLLVPNGGLSTTSTPVQVSLNPFYNCYCTTSLHSSSTPCINEIDLNTLSNNTKAAGFVHYPHILSNQQQQMFLKEVPIRLQE